jgi:hypothetical protein
MARVSDESQIIGDFLDTMFSKGFALCEWQWVGQNEKLVPVSGSIEQILADFYEIDLKKVEKERQLLLASLH